MSSIDNKYSGKLLYIAEDDNFSYILIKEFLSGSGFVIKHAENGTKLVEMVKEKCPDVILLDINMPKKNGLKALKEIREIYPDVPVIAETAYAMPEERQVILDAGCNEYISKPIYKELLISLIDKVLR